MNIVTPGTQELADNIVSNVELETSQDVPLLDKAYTRVLAKALSAVDVLLFKYGGWVLQQMFVRYASDKETLVNGRALRPLVEHGREVGAGDPRSPTRAELIVEVTVTLVGADSLAAGAQLLFPATGVLYVTTAAVPLDAPTVSVRVRASSSPGNGDGSGTIGNLEPGEELEFANPLANVARIATVLSVAVTGADEEDIEDYRARVLRRKQARPQGGALADYQQWGGEPAGIARVYPYAGEPGEVDVYVEAEDEPDGIPTSDQLAAVLASINLDEDGLATRRPANAAVNVLPITRRAFDVAVFGLEAEDTVGAQEAIQAALEDHLLSREPFIEGLSVLPRTDRISSASLSGVVDDVTSTVGATFTSIAVTLSGSPIVAFTLGNGELAKLGALTFP